MEYGIKHYHHEIWQQRDSDGNVRWHVFNHADDVETCHEDQSTSLRIIEVGIQVAKSFQLSERQDHEQRTMAGATGLYDGLE